MHVDHNYLAMTLKHSQCTKEQWVTSQVREKFFLRDSLLVYVVFGHSQYKGKQKEIVEAAVLGELSQLPKSKYALNRPLHAQEPMYLC